MSLDDHELSSSRGMRKNMAFDKKKDNSINPMCNNDRLLPNKTCIKRRQINNNHMSKDKGVSIGNSVNESSWSLSYDDDYIVFCFGDDESFDVIKDEGKHKHSKPVNRKLEYGEDAEHVSDENFCDKKSKEKAEQWGTDQHDQNCVTLLKEDKKKENKFLSRNQQKDNIRRAYWVAEIEGCGMVSTESRDSNQSEGSFSFPVLSWEWIGSPVQMPKSEDLHLRKQKVWSMGFQCCRF